MRRETRSDGSFVMTDNAWPMLGASAMFFAMASVGWRLPSTLGWRRPFGIVASLLIAVAALAAYERDRLEVDVRRGVIRGVRRRLWRTTRREIPVSDVTMLVSEHHVGTDGFGRRERLRIVTAHGSWVPTNAEGAPSAARELGKALLAAITAALPPGAPRPIFRLDDDDPPLPNAGRMMSAEG